MSTQPGAFRWADKEFLAGFAAVCFLTAVGAYMLIAESIGGLPLPLTRHEREARRSQTSHAAYGVNA